MTIKDKIAKVAERCDILIRCMYGAVATIAISCRLIWEDIPSNLLIIIVLLILGLTPYMALPKKLCCLVCKKNLSKGTDKLS